MVGGARAEAVAAEVSTAGRGGRLLARRVTQLTEVVHGRAEQRIVAQRAVQSLLQRRMAAVRAGRRRCLAEVLAQCVVELLQLERIGGGAVLVERIGHDGHFVEGGDAHEPVVSRLCRR